MIGYGAAATGVLIAAIGIAGMANPQRLVDFARKWTTGPRLHLISAFRFAVAALYWFAAPTSRYPVFLQIVAAFALVAGLLTVILPQRVVSTWVNFFVGMPLAAIRGGCVFAASFGLFIIYATV